MMKRLFSTTCIPADAETSKRTFLNRFVRDEDGNVTILSIILIATGAVLSGIAWDLNSFEYRRVALQQIADRAVLAAADLDQTLPPEDVVRDYFKKAGYKDVVTSVNVDEGLNYRTVSVNVDGLVAVNSINGNFSGGPVGLGGNVEEDAQAAARKRMDENRLLDFGMSYDDIVQDVIKNDFTQGAVDRSVSDRIADLRLLVRDTYNGDTANMSDSQIAQIEYDRLMDAQNGTLDNSYRTQEARDIAATLTQEDARIVAELRKADRDFQSNAAKNVQGFHANSTVNADQARLLDATAQRRLSEINDLIATIEQSLEADPTITPPELDVLATIVGSDVYDAFGEIQDARDAGINKKLSAEVLEKGQSAGELLAHAYEVATEADFQVLNGEIRDNQWAMSQGEDGNYISMNVFSEAEERINNVEISLVLDISGSMGWNGKMNNLRDAGNTFVDTVINDSTRDLVSLSIIPYAEHVSAGDEIMSEMNVNQVHDYSHCVDFDDDDFQTTSIGVNAYGSPKTYDQMQHFFWGSSSSNYRTNPACRYGADDDIEAFSQNTAVLKNKIARLSPNGNTSIFLGMKWAAGLLDPSFQPINASLAVNGHTDPTFANRPVAFDDRETLKTVILMTDGENTSSKRINPQVYANASHYAHWNSYNFDWYVNRYVSSSQRQYWSESKYWTSFGDSLLNNICTAAKQNNIIIWSIGFEVSDRSAGVMRNCASSPSHFFRVEGVEIKEAFSAIARQINQLRLTQ